MSKGSVSYSYPLPGGTRPDTPLTTTTGGSYSYDANGNRTGDSSYTYAYDVENRLTGVVSDVAPILGNAYDGDGVRVHQDGGTLGSPVTHFVGPWYEHATSDNVPTVYFPFNGVPIAMKQGDTLSYLHHDYLGSLVAATDVSGNELGWLRYNPFGDRRLWAGTIPTNRLFTGQPRDLADDRLYFFQSRYYDATIGKFFQPDTVSPHWANPQSLNPYAYALNSPLKLIDPSGHDPRQWFNQQWVHQFQQSHGGANPTPADDLYRLLTMLLATGEAKAGAAATTVTTAAPGIGVDIKLLQALAQYAVGSGVGTLSALGGALGGIEQSSLTKISAAAAGSVTKGIEGGSGLLGVARSLGITKTLPGSASTIADLQAQISEILPLLGRAAPAAAAVGALSGAVGAVEDIYGRVRAANGNLAAIDYSAVGGDLLQVGGTVFLGLAVVATAPEDVSAAALYGAIFVAYGQVISGRSP